MSRITTSYIDRAVKRGKELERAQYWDGAIEHYMDWIARFTNEADRAPYPYERIAIIQRKMGDTEGELSILGRYLAEGGRALTLGGRLRKLQDKLEKADARRRAALWEHRRWSLLASRCGGNEGSTTTDRLTVDRPWRIRWSHGHGQSELILWHADGTLARVLACGWDPDTGVNYFEESGAFYLELVSYRADWQFTVEVLTEWPVILRVCEARAPPARSQRLHDTSFVSC